MRRGWGWLLAPDRAGCGVSGLGLGAGRRCAPGGAGGVDSVAAFFGLRYLGGRFHAGAGPRWSPSMSLAAPLLLAALPSDVLPAHGAPGAVSARSRGARGWTIWRFTVSSRSPAEALVRLGARRQSRLPNADPAASRTTWRCRLWLELGVRWGRCIGCGAYGAVVLIRADNLRLEDRDLGAAAAAWRSWRTSIIGADELRRVAGVVGWRSAPSPPPASRSPRVASERAARFTAGAKRGIGLAAMTQRWTPSSWRSKPGQAHSRRLSRSLQPSDARGGRAFATMPPLVFAGEARRLTAGLAEAAEGRAFLLQGGDCAESFKEFHADNIRDFFRLVLQMAVVLTFAGARPVIKVGRIAGQFAKPRSDETETHRRRDAALLSRRHHQRRRSSSPRARAPDPQRLLKAYAPVVLDAEPDPRLCAGRLRRPLQHSPMDVCTSWRAAPERGALS